MALVDVKQIKTAETDSTKVLQPDGSGGVAFQPGGGVVSTVTTTDATVTTLATITIADDTVVKIEVDAVARRTDAAARAGYRRAVLVFREAAGSATIQGPVDSDFTRESTGAWNLTIDVTGNDARIRVTGVASQTINWKSTHRILDVT